MKIKNQITNKLNQLESFIEKPSIKKVLFGLVVLLSFLILYLFNRLQPLFGDDWSYSLVYGQGRRLESFSDIIIAQYHHYFEWGGRTIVHVIAQTLLLVGIFWGDLLNSIAYLLFTLVIYTLCNTNKKLNVSLLLGINILIWFFQPAFASTLLWIVGSANYLWGTLIITSFLIPYIREINHTSRDNYIKVVAMFLFGIIAGWTNENMAIALITMLAILLFYYKKETSKIPKWAIAGLVGCIIGCVLMLKAPGNYVRYNDYISGAEYSVLLFLKQFINALASFYYYCLPLLFIYVISSCLFISFGKLDNKRKVYFTSFLFFIGAIVATLAMSASPFFPGRAAFGINTFLIIATGVFYANLDYSKVEIKRLTYICIFFSLLFFAADFYRGYQELSHTSDVVLGRWDYLESQKKKGETDIVLSGEELEVHTRFLHYWELPSDTADWHNRMLKKYYGVNSVRFIGNKTEEPN